jgi:hypothetical protein
MIRLILSWFFIFSALINGYAELKDEIIIINSTDEKIDIDKSGFVKVIDYDSIHDWGRARGLEIIPDRGPVVDNKAFYFMDFRGVVNISGLRKSENYKLLIDFVKYKKNNSSRLSYVKIFIRDKDGIEHLLAAPDKNELFNEKIFETSLPFRFTYGESFELIIYEYSEIPGTWGIWDMIIYPEKIDVNSIQTIEPETSDKSMKHNLKILE